MCILFLGEKDPLEQEMATHFVIFTWKIPWTETPGGLQSMGLQRVRHNGVTEHCTHYTECFPNKANHNYSRYKEHL